MHPLLLIPPPPPFDFKPVKKLSNPPSVTWVGKWDKKRRDLPGGSNHRRAATVNDFRFYVDRCERQCWYKAICVWFRKHLGNPQLPSRHFISGPSVNSCQTECRQLVCGSVACKSNQSEIFHMDGRLQHGINNSQAEVVFLRSETKCLNSSINSSGRMQYKNPVVFSDEKNGGETCRYGTQL